MSADDRHFLFARNLDRNAMDRVTECCKPIARSFIQYSRSDKLLVNDIHRELVDVRGYRKVAILYRDSVDPNSRREAPTPSLERRLYGPALSDLFRHKNEDSGASIYLDSPFPKAPDRSSDPERYPKKFGEWQERAKSVLLPILRFLERERVEAVGVFGNSAEEKSAIMKIVREKLPGVQLFTSEPDWRLESPDPPVDPSMIPVPSEKAATSPYALNGLMVFSGPIPPADFVRMGFQDLNEVALLNGEDQAFLPSVWSFNTSHIVKRLIELPIKQVNQPMYDALRNPNDADSLRTDLDAFIREPTIIRDRINTPPEASASDKDAGVLMLISDGRLQQITKPRWAPLLWIPGLIPVALILGLLWFLNRPTSAPRDPSTRAATLWAWCLQDSPHAVRKSVTGGSSDEENAGAPTTAANAGSDTAANAGSATAENAGSTTAENAGSRPQPRTRDPTQPRTRDPPQPRTRDPPQPRTRDPPQPRTRAPPQPGTRNPRAAATG